MSITGPDLSDEQLNSRERQAPQLCRERHATTATRLQGYTLSQYSCLSVRQIRPCVYTSLAVSHCVLQPGSWYFPWTDVDTGQVVDRSKRTHQDIWSTGAGPFRRMQRRPPAQMSPARRAHAHAAAPLPAAPRAGLHATAPQAKARRTTVDGGEDKKQTDPFVLCALMLSIWRHLLHTPLDISCHRK
jgi:hypothetical protein